MFGKHFRKIHQFVLLINLFLKFVKKSVNRNYVNRVHTFFRVNHYFLVLLIYVSHNFRQLANHGSYNEL